jgi:Ca2+-binding RTX toxin-like protein
VVDAIGGPSTGGNGDQDIDPSVAALAGGGFVVAWTNEDGVDRDVLFGVFDAAGNALGGGAVEAGGLGVTDDNNEPVVAGLADGSFVIVYDNDEANRMDVEHFSASGSSLGSFNFAGAGASPSVVDLGDGRFTVTWQEGAGEIAMEILDTRDFVNSIPVYLPDNWQVGTIGDDVFTAAIGVEIVHGHDGDDVITEVGSGTIGGDPQIKIFGDAGDDTIIVTSNISNDLYYGGFGANTIDWSAASITEDGAFFDLGAGLAIAASALFSEVIQDFVNLIGTGQDDWILGNNFNNVLDGGGGDDEIEGGGNPDAMTGGAGIDTLSYRFSEDAVSASLATGTGTLGSANGDTFSGFENMLGGAFNDTLTGDGGANRIDGDAGIDTMAGGGNNDVYIVDTQSDVLIETAAGGIDTVETALLNYSLFSIAEVERILFTGFGNFVGRGNGLDNRIQGAAGNDRFVVDQGGADRYFGETGTADTVDYRLSTAGAVINLAIGVHGGAALGDFFSSIEYFYGSNTAADDFTGGAFNDRFDGYGGNDVARGGGGSDTLNGGDGDDEIAGGAALDFLSGNAGADDFNYAAVSDSGPSSGARDRIYDFAAGLDDIDVSAIDASAAGGGNEAFTQFLGAAAFTAEGQVRWHQSGANTVIEFNTTGASGAEMQIQLQNFTAANLTAADFIA